MIQLLSEDTIQKIAAGEVIERPASVIKELVENSIDANATEIIVEIKDGGKSLMKISDNGIGIKADEIAKAFLRHSTSKIVDFTDIYNITSLGFRGEALASVVSISKVKVNTKTEDSRLGMSVVYENNKLINKKPIAMNTGTSMEIRDIFYNVPVRKKFMKKTITEANIITNLMYRFAVGHSNIGFKYIKDDKVIFETHANSTLEESLMDLFGVEAKKDLYKIDINKRKFKIKGYISNNKYYRANRSMQYIYINGRYIEDVDIRRAIEDKYKSIIPNGRFPIYQLFLEMDPAYIDVNIHPNKKFVKITIIDDIIEALLAEIDFKLKNNIELPQIKEDVKNKSNILIKEDFNKKEYDYKDLLEKSFNKKKGPREEDSNLFNLTKDNLLFDVDEPINKQKNNNDFKISNYEDEDIIEENISFFEVDNGKTNNLEEVSNIKEVVKENNTNYIDDINVIDKDDVKEEIISEDINDKSNGLNIEDFKYIGIVFNNYIIYQSNTSDKLYLVDQHAAHERILYEKFMDEYKKQDIIMQDLISPNFLEVSKMEMETFIANKEKFNKLGFIIEQFGETTLAIRSVPVILGSPKNQQMVLDILDTIESDKDISSVEEKIIQKACKHAIKSGDKIQKMEAKGLLENLLKTNYPYTCPHGRPTLLELSKYELEKMFLRVK